MYRLRWYCWAILNGGRFGDLRTIYQGCRALPFALAGLSCFEEVTRTRRETRKKEEERDVIVFIAFLYFVFFTLFLFVEQY